MVIRRGRQAQPPSHRELAHPAFKGHRWNVVALVHDDESVVESKLCQILASG
jgi:hypothetical protein